MVCSKCGEEAGEGKVCANCGVPLERVRGKGPAPDEEDRRTGFKGCLIMGIGLLVIVAAAAVILLALAGGRDKREAQSQVSAAVKAAQQGEAEQLTATDLLAALALNWDEANARYKGKMLMLTGTVASVEVDLMGNTYLALASDNDKNTIITVQCYFLADEVTKLDTVKPGDAVTISGYFPGDAARVMVENCMLLEP